MKFYSTILALCLLQGASAFAPQLAGFTSKAALAASTSGTDITTPTRAEATSAPPSPAQPTKNVWDTLSPTKVQGGSLRTWAITNPSIERMQVLMKTDGRPLNANVELWQGPDNTPQKMRVYVEDGSLRTFSTVIETPRGTNAIAIRNIGHLEFPLDACVEPDVGGAVGAVVQRLNEMGSPTTLQGGAISTFPFAPAVASVQVQLLTDGRPLNSRLELLQGPNNNKQVVDIYTEDALERPVFFILETPGVGNVVRVVNTGSVEFPLIVRCEPYLVEQESDPALMTVSEGRNGYDGDWWNK